MTEKYMKDQEFLQKIESIIADPVFVRLKEKQHHQDSVYEHVLRVTYRAYGFGKKCNVQENELLRGALFHDLYFHDWRDKEFIMNHGWVHPKIALQNAREHFGPITDREANIIESHMWPMNFFTFPRYKEAVLVTLSDKWIATSDVIIMFYNFIARNIKKIFGKKNNSI